MTYRTIYVNIVYIHETINRHFWYFNMNKIIKDIIMIIAAAVMIICTGCGKDNSKTSEVTGDGYIEGETEDFTYRKYADHVVLTKWTGIESRAVIPAEVDGVPVTELSSPELYSENAAFSGNLAVTSVIIPDSVKTINRYCFYHCTALRDAVIPNSVKTIGIEAFQGCKSLLNVTLPESLKELPDGCFDECSALRNIRLPDDIGVIGRRAFHKCERLENVILPESVKEVGECAFTGCSSLSSITFLSSDCTIADQSDTISGSESEPEIRGVTPSTAKDYAEKYGKPFRDINSDSEIGDVNGDKSIDSNDASLIMSGYAAASIGSEMPFEMWTADTNGDGNITAADASLVLGYYSSLAVGNEMSFLEYAALNH